MDYGISAGYGFNTSFGDTAVDNLKQWNIGASIVCDNIKISGAYKYLDWGINGDAYVFDAGVSYSYGVYGLSFGFIGSSGDKDMGDVVQDSLLLTGTYNMAKGIDLFGTIGWGDYKGSTGTENDGWSVISGMMINF